jgi:hypothetical protein
MVAFLIEFYCITTFSEGMLYSSTSLISTIALHIEIISLVDGTYELIQESDEDISEAQVIVAELTEVSNFDSEEPKFTNFIDITKGKSRCIILLF